MKYVLDTNVLVAAVRSPTGASAEILRRVLNRRIEMLCSVPLLLEYEAVLTRPEQLHAAGVSIHQVNNLIDVLAGVVQTVNIHFLWRPQLRDPSDDMVLETAINGSASDIITFNQKDFLPQAHNFGLRILRPAQYFQQGANDGNK
jgi:putative PIN family toxin of toxin-antitoxin system